MSNSVSAILAKLVAQFQPNLDMIRSLSSAEVRTYDVIKGLLESCEGDCDCLEELVEFYGYEEEESGARSPSPSLREISVETPVDESRQWSSVEMRFTPQRLDIMKGVYLRNGRKSCMKKFKLDESDWQAVHRYFMEGVGEHVKSQRIKDFVSNEFRDVSVYSRRTYAK